MDQPEDTSAGFLPNYTSLMLSNYKEKFRGKFDVYLCAEEQRCNFIYIKLFKKSIIFESFISYDLDQRFDYSV